MFDCGFWNEYMTRYDDAIGTLRPYQKLVKRCVDWGVTRSGATQALDLGSGTGNLLRTLADRVKDIHVVGVEHSKTARALAAAKFDADEASEFVARDLEQRGWSAGLPAAELCFMNNVLYDLAEPETVLAELAELMPAGGRLILSNPHAPRPEVLVDAHQQWRSQASTAERERDDRYGDARAWMLEANRELAQQARARRLHFLGADGLRGLLARVGFETLRITDDAYAGVNLLVEARKVG